MSTSLDRYRVLIPAHSGVDDAVVTAELSAAALTTNASAWGTLYTDAMVFLAAHHVQTFHVDESSVTGQVVVQQRDGDLSRTYANAAMGDGEDDLRTTKYGLRYLRLRGQVAGMPRYVGVGT